MDEHQARVFGGVRVSLPQRAWGLLVEIVYQAIALVLRTLHGWRLLPAPRGPAECTPVLVVPGYTENAGMMLPLAFRLARAGFNPVLIDFPSTLHRIESNAEFLARRIAEVRAVTGAAQVAIVAHSMGGLVGRRAVNELCRNGKPRYLRVYASFDTPYGGVESAAGAVERGTELVPSWVDVAAGSSFLTRLYETPLPKDLPFHLFFGWGEPGDSGPSPAGDGTIALPSQLDPRAQAAATRMMGYGDTHVGILSDASALKELRRVLDETTGAP
jgi:pimeloyl-ACP methyl ester carboxylesterase